MRKDQKFTDDQLRTLLDLGLSQAQAARSLGVDPAAVCIRLKRWRSPKPPRDRTVPNVIRKALAAFESRPLRERTDKLLFTDEQLHEFLVGGLNLNQAASRLGVSMTAVAARIKEWKGLARDRRKPPVIQRLDETDEAYALRLKDVRQRARQAYKKCMSDPDRKKRAREREKVYAENPDYQAKRTASSLAYYRRNVHKQTARNKRRRQTDIEFRISCNLRGRLNTAVRQARVGKSTNTMALVGCDIAHLMCHLVAQFTDGMSWENYREWHIDHHIPVCAFDLRCPLQQRLCFGFWNLKPLWKLDNLKKRKADLAYAREVKRAV